MPDNNKDILDLILFGTQTNLFDKVERHSSSDEFSGMLHHPEIQKSLLRFFENFCASSELNILQRIAELEDKVEALLEENAELKEKLQSKIEKVAEKITESGQQAECPSTITDIRTDHLVTYMESNEEIPEVDSGFVNLKCKCMNSKVFKNFVTSVLPESLRPKSFKNLRKLKKDLFENAVTRYNDIVTVDKAWYGNKETRLIYAQDISLRSVTSVTG